MPSCTPVQQRTAQMWASEVEVFLSLQVYTVPANLHSHVIVTRSKSLTHFALVTITCWRKLSAPGTPATARRHAVTFPLVRLLASSDELPTQKRDRDLQTAGHDYHQNRGRHVLSLLNMLQHKSHVCYPRPISEEMLAMILHLMHPSPVMWGACIAVPHVYVPFIHHAHRLDSHFQCRPKPHYLGAHCRLDRTCQQAHAKRHQRTGSVVGKNGKQSELVAVKLYQTP